MAKTRSPPSSGIEVDLRWFVAGLSVISVCSFLAGLQQSSSEKGLLTKAEVYLPPIADRSKIVRNTFVVERPPEEIHASNISLSFDPTAASAGEHLLVDIKGVDADFLDSESRLAQAMVETAKIAGLDLLSYHCHSLEPKGVSCVSVLLESHMSFHTWPDEGVITLDLYVTTVSSNKEQQAKQQPLVPVVVETMKRLFGVRQTQTTPRPLDTRWSHEFRGFDPAAAQPEYGKIHLAGSDLSLWVLSPLELYSKTLIHSSFTQPNQRVDIWDVVEVTDTPSEADIEKHGLKEGDPRLLTPELASPDRHFFLNGQHIATIDDDDILMETIAHPALFANVRPTKVTIAAGPAALANGVVREVLKHKTIESITCYQASRELVEVIAPQHLPKLSNCSNLQGREPNCLANPQVDLRYYGEKPVSSVLANVDPNTQDVLYVLDYISFLKSTSNISDMLANWMDVLTAEGVLLIPLGHAAAIQDPRPDLGVHASREELMVALEAQKHVAAILVYEEGHCRSMEPLSFLLVCKHISCRQRWYARSDQVEYQIYDRIVRSNQVVPAGKVKLPVLTYYDGTTQRSYHWPKKGWETVYCKREPTPWECSYIHLNSRAEFHEIDVHDESKGSFRIVKDENNETTRVFATKNIPKGSYIMAEHLASSLMLTSRNLEGLVNSTLVASPVPSDKQQEAKGEDAGVSRATVIEYFLDFFQRHSHASLMPGSEQHYIEVGGTTLIRQTDIAGEANIEPWVPRRKTPNPKYSPVYERHRESFDVLVIASRDIQEGEEVVMFKDMWTKPTVQ